LSSSSAKISLYCLQYVTAKAEHTKNDKSESDYFIWTDDEVELLLKVCIEYKTSKTNEKTDRRSQIAKHW